MADQTVLEAVILDAEILIQGYFHTLCNTRRTLVFLFWSTYPHLYFNSLNTTKVKKERKRLGVDRGDDSY